MKVKISDTENYWVIWNYPVPQLVTHCIIYDDSIQGQSVLKQTGISWCGQNDTFKKEIGRKVSLTRALASLFPNDSNKRKIFWESYLNRK